VSPEFLESARKRIVLAIRDDETFWRKWEALDADNS
jgi:hypothetical protein